MLVVQPLIFMSPVQVHPSLHDAFEQLLKGVQRGADSALKQWLDSHALAEHRPDFILAVLGSQVCCDSFQTSSAPAGWPSACSMCWLRKSV